MVQGLGFLSKKSWHTKNIANQEKVWMAEEREKAEKVKTAELAKQIQQEREEDELRRVTGTGKSLDRGIAWLYDGHKKDSETAKEDAAKQAEEYLLGKPIAASDAKIAGDFETTDTQTGVHAIVEAHAHDDDEAPAEDSVAHRNEAFRIRHEDPMYAVSLQSVRQEKAVEHRKDLYERAGIQVATVRHNDDEDASRRKHSKKKDKKRKKAEKKHRKRRSDSHDSDESRRHRKRRHRSRSVEKDRRRQRSRSYDSRDERRRHRRSRSVSDEPRHHRRRRSRSPEYQDRQQRFDEDRRQFETDEFGRSFQPNRNHSKPDAPKRVEGYGLQGSSYRPSGGPQHLGPDPELVRAKRHARDAERHERMQRTSGRRHASAADREEARREMERDAAHRSAARGVLKRPPVQEEDANDRSRNGAAFLRDATVKAHGLGDKEMKLSDRLHENRHKHQRLTDSFL